MIIPSSTYRIQFTPDFTLVDLEEQVDYLHRLGISHVYASPIMTSRKGSMHGYDTVDYHAIDPELGGRAAFQSCRALLNKRNMGWLQDIVPNHMAYSSQNKLIMDVCEKGEQSLYYHYFDINWDHFWDALKGKVLAPFLGSYFSSCLENREIQLVYDERGLSVCYYKHRFPLLLSTYSTVFNQTIEQIEHTNDVNGSDVARFVGTLDLLSGISQNSASISDELVNHAKGMLWGLYCTNNFIKTQLDQTISQFNGAKGEKQSFDALDTLLAKQVFRLAYWKVAAEEINYRRFFTVNDLICMRVEDEKVFEDTHRYLFYLINLGLIDGIRIDHIDGLYDPQVYLQRIRARYPKLYVVVEKILGEVEQLPLDWPVQGTTGYDFLALVNSLQCRRESIKSIAQTYFRFSGKHVHFIDVMHDKKRLIIGKHLAGNVDNLAHVMKRVVGLERYGRDITMYGLKRALVEVLTFFPVYRSYVNESTFSAEDRVVLHQAVELAKTHNPALQYELEFIESFFLSISEINSTDTTDGSHQIIHFIMEFQQVTGPLMAKGCEDTAFYSFNKLISLNEVGGDPRRFGLSTQAFHVENTDRNRRNPHTMNATATHDTKRGEDTRARINVLSELPVEWKKMLTQWKKVNRTKKVLQNGSFLPDDNDEYFLYQTLLGTFPFGSCGGEVGEEEMQRYVERMQEYVVKAVREAKVHTAWIKPDEEYEKACASFVGALLDGAIDNPFLELFKPFSAKIACYGMYNSITQTVLKMTCPGVPDIYQGAELWDFSVVDPDNRRPVDYSLRTAHLNRIKGMEASGNRKDLINNLLSTRADGTIKLYLIYRILHLRGVWKEAFSGGSYVPLRVDGRYKNNVIAFLRISGENAILVVVTRFLTMIVNEERDPIGESVWQDTAVMLPMSYRDTTWVDSLSGVSFVNTSQRMRVGTALTALPCVVATNAAID